MHQVKVQSAGNKTWIKIWNFEYLANLWLHPINVFFFLWRKGRPGHQDVVKSIGLKIRVFVVSSTGPKGLIIRSKKQNWIYVKCAVTQQGVLMQK